MRTRRTLAVLLVAFGLLGAACSDSDDDPGVDAADGSAGSASDAEDADDADDADATPIAFVPLEPGAVTFEALENGDVDMAVLFSTQGVIAEQGWVVLEDDLTLQGSDNVIPLIRTEKVDGIADVVLDDLSSKLTTEALTELNRRVDGDKEDTEVVARDFIDEVGITFPEETGSGTIVVGSANFSEAEIVAQMYKLVLEEAGYTVELEAQLGSREVLVPALQSGEIDVEPEYLQSLLVFLDPDAPAVTPEEGVAALADVLPDGLSVLRPSPAQDQNAIVVTAEVAERYGLEKVSDLLTVTDQLTLAGPPECPERPLCIPGYEGVYGLQFAV